MKLFGNKRGAARLGKKRGVPGTGRVGKRRLNGLQRGVILLAACLGILTGTVVAVYKSFVRPVEISQPAPVPIVTPADDTTEQKKETEETTVFLPPTTVKNETKVDEETGTVQTVEVEVPASHKTDFYNILVLGTDDDGIRTDTIMIGRIDVQAHTVALMSIPRDTLIDGDYAVPKINGVYGYAGRGEAGIQALQTKLAELLGFEVDGYAMINLGAFVDLVNLVGGVEFDVPMDMDYEDASQDLHIHLKAGVQHLDGEEAMQLVRFRKGYATQDIQRTKVQQAFLRALAKQCLSVVNLAKIDDMAEIFLENVKTDLTLGNIVYFAREFLKCDFENMFTYTLEGEAVMVDGASCYALYRQKTLEAVNKYFNPYELEIKEEHVRIRTPESVRAEQQAEEAEQDAELPEADDPAETDEPSEPPKFVLPTDDWLVELPGDEEVYEAEPLR